MKKNNFLLLSLLLVLSVVLAACNFGGSEKDSSTTDGNGAKELNLVTASEPPSLHPQLATDSSSGAILQNVFEGLTTVKDGEVVEAAADKIDISEDLLTYTFTLKDAKWSNGDTVTAEDFAYAWKFALNPESASEYASILYPIKGAESYNLGEGTEEDLGIKVVDEKTLEVTLENPTPYFLELTAFKTYYPIHKATAEANDTWYAEAGDSYVTNGPFTLADWKHSASITLEKNDQYWDAENVALDRVNISMVENEATASTMFDAGEIDFLGAPFQTVSLDVIDRYKQEGILNIQDFASIYIYKFNTTGEFTSNANIRKALTLAIDRQGLIDNVLKGEQTPALGMVPTAVPGFEEDRGYFKDNDIEEAKAALEAGMKELGISNPSEISIGLSINTSEAHSSIAQFIQEGWHSNLGIDVTIDNSEWQVYLDKLTSLDFDVARMGWTGDYNDAYSFLESYDSADNGNNDTGWENPEYAQLLKQSLTETDENARFDLLKQAEGIAMAEFPIAPIYYYTSLHVKKDYVQNMEPDALGNVYLKYVDINK
ncbi:peptide ABC transporter substrate-binding protein [Ureibacillus chungkukjangi]|uniref:Oligopeptide transport system substrate-binding protein n=1 Tax=Ureibacillus chungkukjangi TaxID=1202712 RepID=A0A318TRU1_9BACL|nr:peptide ABC transporter substrate-binding protein [Ureibacillus chungkukjangi]MCM3388739.1 peptide ABC transporter substrate-binding protein [Ureibacillus chungkukjangi]PYF06647.1 oligopeptide transport system substrate-binding protein [Ureibacillus chungkukjangi]